MNLIDLFAVMIIALGVLIGYNQGFIKSMFNVVNIVLSILIGLLFYGLVAQNITNDNPNVVPTVVHFSESSELLGGIENERISVYEKPYEELMNLVEGLQLPYPLPRLLEKNIEDQVYSVKGIETLGDYLGQTIGHMTLNYVSFILVFFISFLIMMVIISIGDYVFEFPVLRSMDAVAGGIGGLIQGLLVLNVIFLAVPLVLAFLPFDELKQFVDGSSFAGLYYYRNILTKIIRGAIV